MKCQDGRLPGYYSTKYVLGPEYGTRKPSDFGAIFGAQRISPVSKCALRIVRTSGAQHSEF